MMPHRQKQLKRMRKRVNFDIIDEGQPWRYNPECSEDERWEIFRRLSPHDMGVYDTLGLESYFPEKKELPDEGGWIWMLRPPHTPVKCTFGALYFARPWMDAQKTHGWKDMKYSVTAYTEGGEVRLWPHEYSFPNTTEMIEFWAEGAFVFHPFDEALSGVELTERLFYITSRGIPMKDALPMALGEILQPVGWFEIVGAEKFS